MNRRRPPTGFLIGVAVVALFLLCFELAQAQEIWLPERNDARESIGGWVSSPSVPFPVPKDAVESAIPIYEAMLKVIRLAPPGPVLGRGLGFLAGLYGAKGDFLRAEDLYGQAEAVLEKNGGTPNDLGWVHNNRGMTRMGVRRFAEAALSFRRALKAIDGVGNDLEERRALVWQNLASAYHLLGDSEAAEQAYLSAMKVFRRIKKDNGRQYQLTVNNLAILYGSMGDFESARHALEGLLERGGIWDPSARFAVLLDLGEVLRSLKDFKGAESRLSEALNLAGGGVQRAQVLMTLAAAHADSGQWVKAKKEAEDALDLLKRDGSADSSMIGGVKATLGSLSLFAGDLRTAEAQMTESKASLSKGSARDRWIVADLNRGLALVAERQGHHPKALELSRLALDQEIEKLDQILAYGSEAQRLAYQRNAYLYDYLAEIGDGPLLAEAVLRLKGVVLDSLLEERVLVRRTEKPEDRRRLDHIHELKVAAMESLAQGGTGKGSHDDDLARELKEEETALAKSVALPSRLERSRSDLTGVQRALRSDQVLVELMRFQLSLPGGGLEPHYGAVVIPHSGFPCWVPLGQAQGLDASVQRLVDWMDGGNRGGKPDAGPPPAEAGNVLRELFDQLWKPLVAKFPPGTRSVLVSPDGALHFVPWAALVDHKGAFVAEAWAVSQVASGRDLLRSVPAAGEKTVLALADGMGNLPYAREEVNSLAQTAKAQGWEATVLAGDQASEPALFAHRSPGILHLATHGGQLREDLSSAIASRLSRLPMYSAYVLLGGARESLEAWSKGTIPPFSSDGILTAEEVGGLDLSRTWLTVLSACSTGSGESRDGEGVLGLRRGFALAGTGNLLFTLWSVDDRATAQFMERFYERLFASKDPIMAFQETQLARLLRLKETEHDIRRAVAQAGGFVLTR